jgi:hypothetical protein
MATSGGMSIKGYENSLAIELLPTNLAMIDIEWVVDLFMPQQMLLSLERLVASGSSALESLDCRTRHAAAWLLVDMMSDMWGGSGSRWVFRRR